MAGGTGTIGAAALAASGCLRAGAGLVTVACPADQEPSLRRYLRPEAMTLPLPSASSASLRLLRRFLESRRVSAAAVGPGLGTHASARAFIKGFFAAASHAPRLAGVVADADALRPDLLAAGKSDSPARILTPHPGEAARLLNCSIAEIQKNRIASAREIARRFRAVCLLKGRHTVIADAKEIWINPTGNPGMATAGAGDVLTGGIAALLGQGLPPVFAACAGAYLHGLAGDLAARRKTRPGLIAGDIAEFLPAAFRRIGVR